MQYKIYAEKKKYQYLPTFIIFRATYSNTFIIYIPTYFEPFRRK